MDGSKIQQWGEEKIAKNNDTDVYTAFRSSNKVVMRRAAACCLVLSIFTSLLCNENKATSAPDVIKLNNNKTRSSTIFKTVPCGLAKSK
jgi:hypothetical protein